MTVTATELKTNFGKYLAMASQQDIFIVKNGKNVAKLTRPVVDKLPVLDSLVGIIPADTETDIREERLARQ